MSAIWCRIWKAWVGAGASAASVRRRAAGSKRRSGAVRRAADRDAVAGVEPGRERGAAVAGGELAAAKRSAARSIASM